MSKQAQKIVGIARAEKGYHEGRSGGHWNNDQKYSDQTPGLEWSDRMAWCAVFVSWCAMKAGLAALYPRTASCAYGVDWFKDRKQFGFTPRVGAQVFFGKNGGSHTGLVVAFDDEWITTVEGNSNATGSAEGDGVYEQRHRRKDAWVYGYGYPAFKADAPKPPAHVPAKPAPNRIVPLAAGVHPGAHHKQVKELQQLLVKAGYGPIPGAPSDFYGPETQRAVARFHDRNPKYRAVLHDPRIGPKGFAALQKQAGRR